MGNHSRSPQHRLLTVLYIILGSVTTLVFDIFISPLLFFSFHLLFPIPHSSPSYPHPIPHRPRLPSLLLFTHYLVPPSSPQQQPTPYPLLTTHDKPRRRPRDCFTLNAPHPKRVPTTHDSRLTPTPTTSRPEPHPRLYNSRPSNPLPTNDPERPRATQDLTATLVGSTSRHPYTGHL